MIIADKLKATNRAEYLLYLWQVEDLIRSYGLDETRIAREYVSTFDLSDELRQQTEQWYADLTEMMRSEGKRRGGHLQLSLNVLQELTELHNALLDSPYFTDYSRLFYRVVVYVVELRSRYKQEAPDKEAPSELECCFNLLYGVMVLRLQQKTVSEGTEKAAKDVAALLAKLSDYYFKDKAEPLRF